ncbi:DUF1758 domain-containing protein [Trichonephila clavipes]|nr:DUF1758 domain-containing protein [Trichonephila clavipes]
MEEYEKLSHMSPNKELDGKISYFLPRHAVRRKDSITTKLRVVFDGSCKPRISNSLNTVLRVGQILQTDIFTLLVRFRVNEIAFTADIKQMYRQILIDPDGQNLQKIVWRKSLGSNIKEYKHSRQQRMLWLLKLDWDDALLEHFVLNWRKFQMEFQQVCHLSIPRWLQITNKQVTLHGFSDAWETAYACVIYAVQRNREST